MAFAVQDVRDRNLWLSSNKQNTYGTALAAGNLTRRMRFNPEASPQITREYFSDLERAGKGHDFPTVRQLTSKDTQFRLAGEVDDFLAGWLAAFGLGAIATSGAGPYTHTCTFEQTTRTAPVTTLYYESGSGVKSRFTDMAVESLRLSGGKRGPIMFDVSLRGSGSITEGSIAPAALPTPVYLLANDADILIGAPGAAASIKERVVSWEVNISTGLEQHRAPGGGAVATFAKLGKQRATVKLVIAQIASDDLRTLFVNDTQQELQINVNSGAAAQMNIKFPNLYFRATQGNDGIDQTFELASEEVDVFKLTEPIQIVAINSQATFLVGA